MEGMWCGGCGVQLCTLTLWFVCMCRCACMFELFHFAHTNTHTSGAQDGCAVRNGGCGSLCLTTPTGPTCACSSGLMIINNTSCPMRELRRGWVE